MKLSEKWGLQPADGAAAPENALPPLPTVDVTDSTALHALEQAVTAAPYVAVLAPEGLDALTLCDGKACYALAWAQLGDDYNAFRLLMRVKERSAGSIQVFRRERFLAIVGSLLKMGGESRDAKSRLCGI